MTTRLLSVKWEVGRTGKLTPAAALEPVDIAGVVEGRGLDRDAADVHRLQRRRGRELARRLPGAAPCW